jgi:3D (Asp-Asp-Asp) domain-containing protein
VLGQAHTPRRRSLPFAAIALVVLAAPALGLAGSTQSATSLRAQNARLESRSRSAVLELYSLDQRLTGARTELSRLERDAASLRAQRADLTRTLAIARRGNRIAQRQVAARLRLMYEQGDVEPLEIIFGSKNLDEALSSLDSLNRMTHQSEDVLRQLGAARANLKAASARLATRQAAIATAAAGARATADALSQTRVDRRAYLSSLAAKRRLNETQIASLLAQARAAQLRSDALARPVSVQAPVVTRVAASPAAATSRGRTLTVIATGYSMPGTTATGLPVGWGVAAVDPSVIPLGTHLTIPGYGVAVAADTGGAVAGATIDLWFPTIAQANAWGRRVVTIVLR